MTKVSNKLPGKTKLIQRAGNDVAVTSESTKTSVDLGQEIAGLRQLMQSMTQHMQEMMLLVDTIEPGRHPNKGAPSYLISSKFGSSNELLSISNTIEFTGSVLPSHDYEFEFMFRDDSDRPSDKEILVEVYMFSKLGQKLAGPYPGTAMSNFGAPFLYLQERHLIGNKAVISLKSIEDSYTILIRLRPWLASVANKKISIASVARLMRKGESGIFAAPSTISKSAATPVNAAPPASVSPAILKPRSVTEKKLRALYILDEISELNWSPHFHLRPLKRGEDLKAAWEAHEADFLFLESCWNGNKGDWEYAFTSPGLKHKNAQELISILEKANTTGLTTYFWNKEDPLHYEKFLPIAEKCSIIGTTDVNMLPRYQKDIPAAVAQVLPFAASPSLCNPTDRFRRDPEDVCFAGTYYVHGHNDRRDQMDAILQAIVAFNGAIYDRYSHLKNDRYEYPDIFKPFLRPSVPFSEVIEVYKQFRLFLNVNTITDSATMMSRRVYEILATGTPVLSTPSLAIEKQFNGIVRTASTGADAIEEAAQVLTDDMSWRRLSHLGYREVHDKHTYRHLSNIIESGVLRKATGLTAPLVSIICASIRPVNLNQMIKNVEEQNYPNVEVIYIVTPNFDEVALERLRSTRNVVRAEVIVLPMEETLGQCLNAGVRSAEGEYIAKFDDDNLYLENYLRDIMLPFAFDEDYWIVGKEAYFCYLEGNDRLILRNSKKSFQKSAFVSGDAMVMRRKVFEQTGFPSSRVGEDSKLLRDVTALGGKIYSSDYFNFVKVRNADLSKHTWKESEDALMRQSEVISRGLDLTYVRI